MFLKDIGPRAQNMLTILSSIVNTIGRPLWPLNEHEKSFTLKMNKMFVQTPNIVRQMATCTT